MLTVATLGLERCSLFSCYELREVGLRVEVRRLERALRLGLRHPSMLRCETKETLNKETRARLVEGRVVEVPGEHGVAPELLRGLAGALDPVLEDAGSHVLALALLLAVPDLPVWASFDPTVLECFVRGS